MFWITTAAFLAVCTYAELTREQLVEIRRSNDLADKAFFTANRPYLTWIAGQTNSVIPPVLAGR
jgi:hypothetical protein